MSTSSLYQPTMIDVLWPAEVRSRWLRAAALAIAGSLLVAACSQIQVPLWPVPITGQTFAVLVIGMAYGWRLGAATLALYLCQGAAGLPVFSGFSGGLAVLAGPTAGYIVGFVLAAGLVGFMAERGWDRSVVRTAVAMVVGNLVIYLAGVPWLALFLAGTGASDPWATALSAGLVPFLLGDAVKLALAAAAFPVAWRLVRRWRP